MIFPAALLLTLLSISLSPAFALTISGGSDALVARNNEQQALEAREFYGLDAEVMEKRGLADEDVFAELVARSPEPEPMPFTEDVSLYHK